MNYPNLTRVRNKKGRLNIINFAAEYSFKRVCEKHVSEYFENADEKSKSDFWLIVQHFDIAIKNGLTYELSTTMCEETDRIWKIVEREINGN